MGAEWRGHFFRRWMAAPAAWDFEDSRHADVVSVLHGRQCADCPGALLDRGCETCIPLGGFLEARRFQSAAGVFPALHCVSHPEAVMDYGRWNGRLDGGWEVSSVHGFHFMHRHQLRSIEDQVKNLAEHD